MIRAYLRLIVIPLLLIMSGEILAQDPYLWKKRVIILAANDTPNEELRRQMEILGSDSAGLEERDLLVIELEEAVKMNILDKSYASRMFPASGYTFYLRGKDGGIKYLSETAVSLEKLYAIIDAMPMRRREMRKPDH